MDCRSCGVVNAPARRYCRECGARLGQSCTVCHFFNAGEDKYCGGCGRRLKVGAAALAADVPPAAAFVPAIAGDGDFPGLESQAEPTAVADAGIDGQGVSQSEIDGLFENILDEEPGAPGGGGA